MSRFLETSRYKSKNKNSTNVKIERYVKCEIITYIDQNILIAMGATRTMDNMNESKINLDEYTNYSSSSSGAISTTLPRQATSSPGFSTTKNRS